jgi:hypothetical protein
MTMPNDLHLLPLEFRSNIVKDIMAHISAGDSCSIVGIGSVGKTNLLRFLQQQTVKQKYLKENAQKTVILYVDCNKLLETSRWGLFELMLYQIHQWAALDNPINPEYIDALYSSMESIKRKKFGVRYIDSALHHICNQQGFKVVFLIDEFDQVYRKLPKKTFSGLRALRDEYKYQLCYIPATRMELNKIRKPSFEIEGFSELATPRTIWLGPLNTSDANHAIIRISSRYKTKLSEGQAQTLLKITGGHPGLLSMALSSINVPNDNLEDNLLNQRNIQEECYRILGCVKNEEHKTLMQIATGITSRNNLKKTILKQLEDKGLIGGTWASSEEIFSSLFRLFLLQENPVAGRRIRVDRKNCSVWLDGYLVNEIQKREFELLALLEENKGETCSYDSIVRSLYPKEDILLGSLPNDDRIKSVLKRLRKSLRKYIQDPNIIETKQNVGLRLNDPVS